ncbi:MAG: type II toxin-antitoxin system VapC family toxin [Vicinamibacteria bacterium]
MLVADASVLVELVIAGRHVDGADALLERYAATTVTLVSAAHGPIEATSAIRRLVLRDELGDDDGSRALSRLAGLEIALDPPGPRLRDVWSLRARMSAYDAAYAAAARALGAPLVTADTRLLRACADAGIAARHLDELAGAA